MRAIPSQSPWRSRLWMVQLVAGLVMIAAYFTVIPDALLDPAFFAIGLYGTACVLAGVRLWRPDYALVWYLVALGVIAYLAGDAIFTWQTSHTGSEPPVPSLADAFYYAMYPLLGASVFLTIRRQQPGRDRPAAIDAALVTVAMAVLTWTYLIAPYANDPSLSTIEKLASVGYPLCDLMLVALLARLLMIPGRRAPACSLLVAALVFNLLADGNYLYETLEGTFEARGFSDLGWLLAYVLFGAAALHPSMREYGRRVEVATHTSSQRRLVALSFAALSAPALILLRVGSGNTEGVAAIALGCIVMFGLVLLRMRGLLDEVGAQHRELQDAYEVLQRAQSERQLLLDRTVEARADERSSLADDLHDGPIQRLSSVALTLERAIQGLQRGDPDAAADLLERGQDGLQAELESLRRLMSVLRPPILDEIGFEAGVRDLVDDVARRTGLEGRLIGSLRTALEPDTETALYRVVQESLWNVGKHARATEVEVRLRDHDSSVELTVTDDGIGFRPASSRTLLQLGHFGLVGMQERLESAGGQLVVESAPGAGTRITARIPRGLPGDADRGPGQAATLAAPELLLPVTATT